MDNIIGISKHIEELKEQIRKAAENDENVLITGPTGTGKELVAENIHTLSQRKEKLLVPIDCGAIPPSLFESELFGHEKSAFTGASKREGKLAVAEGGTLFLDEIGNLKDDQQAVLMRFLNDKKYSPIGSNRINYANVRIICATNRDLRREKSKGTFRRDLYARMAQRIIKTESLKNRPEDLVAIIKKRYPDIDPKVKFLLYSYGWPENIRELENDATKDYQYVRDHLLDEAGIILNHRYTLDEVSSYGCLINLVDSINIQAASLIILEAIYLRDAICFAEAFKMDYKRLCSSYEVCLLKSRGFTNDRIANFLEVRRSNLSKFQDTFGFPMPTAKLNNLYPDFIQHLQKTGYYPSPEPPF